MVTTFVILVIVGCAIGILSGLIGVGGGTVMIPIFRLALDMSPVASTATSLFTIIPTSISGAATHIRRKTCLPKLGVAMGLGGACTSPLGVWLAQLSPGWLVITASALAIGYSAFTILRKALRADAEADANEQPLQAPEFSRADLAKGFAIGVATGVVSGFIGLGGGFLMIPLMVTVMNFPMKLASGTSLIGIMILAIPGAVFQCMLGNVDFLAGIAIACGSIPGAILGARLTSRVPERALKLIFAGFLFIAAILLLLKEIGVLG